MLQGAGLAAFLTLFRLVLYSRRSGAPSVSEDLALILLAGAAGGVAGLVYFATDTLREHSGWRRTMANVATLLIWCVIVFALVMVAFSGQR